MVNLKAALQQIRRTREELDAPPSENFDRYRSEYEVILDAVADLAGDEAFDDLKEWMIDTTVERERLPDPDELRDRARSICHEFDATIPRQSPLRD